MQSYVGSVRIPKRQLDFLMTREISDDDPLHALQIGALRSGNDALGLGQ